MKRLESKYILEYSICYKTCEVNHYNVDINSVISVLIYKIEKKFNVMNVKKGKQKQNIRVIKVSIRII